MSPMRARAASASGDSGLTLIEIVVSLVIFGIISSGIIAGAVTITRMSADNRSREIAANLAAQELDAVRLIGDPFAVHNSSYRPTTNPAFLVTRSTAWVSVAGADTACGSSTNVQYRRVNVSVTWTGQLPTTRPVQTDMIMAPNGPISDPTTGTITIGVLDRSGQGEQGVSVTVTPDSGGAVALPAQPIATDADGCTIATNVQPGSYRVTISKSSHISSLNLVSRTQSLATAPYQIRSVAAGSTSGASFIYDDLANFSFSYASNYSAASQPALPQSLPVTLITPNDGNWVAPGTPTSLPLFPYANGYVPIAGDLGGTSPSNSCLSVDPSNWQPGTSNVQHVTAGTPAPASIAAPGGTATISVPMAVVLIQSPTAQYVSAVSTIAQPGSDDPGCTVAPTYSFGQVSPSSGYIAIALPYGTYTISAGSTATGLSPVQQTKLSVPTNAAGGGVAAGGRVTLDPRKLG